MKNNLIALLFLSATVLLTFTVSGQLDQSDWNQIGASPGRSAAAILDAISGPLDASQYIYNERVRAAHGQIYRVFNGQTYNVVRSDRWQWIYAKIFQKSDGILILKHDMGSKYPPTFYAVTNFSTFNGEIVAGKSMGEFVIRIGT